MKLMFASDIHGSFSSCSRMLKAFDMEKAEKLFLLGDILYHGPRNDLPAGYAPKEVARLLNERRSVLFCVGGNCDSEVDQTMLDFPISAEYALLFLNERTVFITHGHKYNNETPPLLQKGDILLHGHTHIQTIETNLDYVYINPGSVSIPKENNPKSYMIFDDGKFSIKSLDDNSVLNEYSI